MAVYRLATINHGYQTFNTSVNDTSLRITLRFMPSVSMWLLSVFNITEAEWLCQGQPVALGTPLLSDAGHDFVFFIEDNSSLNIDPIEAEDFASRITLWVADNDQEILRAFLPA